MPSEIRKDYLQERYVLIAPRDRGLAAEIERPERLNHAGTICEFCPASVNALQPISLIGSKHNWHVKTIAHRSPVLTTSNPSHYGRQEVVIETPNHLHHFEDLPAEHLERIFETYSHRQRELARDPNIRYITINKTGGKAQSHLLHPHSVISAASFIPPDIMDRVVRLRQYQQHHGRCAYCDVTARESRSQRAIYENDDVLVFAPFASFHNYEVWVMPKRHISQISQLNPSERIHFASLLKLLTRAISRLHLPYQFAMPQISNNSDYHFFLQLIPRGSVWSSPELSAGLVVNHVSPEAAAQYYREGLKNS